MKRTNLTNFYQKFHRHRKQKNQQQPPPAEKPMENDLDDLLEYDDEFSRTTHSVSASASYLEVEFASNAAMNPKNDGVPLSVELARATCSSPDSQEIFLRLPSGSEKVVNDDNEGVSAVKPSDLEYDELDLESIYENSSKAATPATNIPHIEDEEVDDEQILFEGETCRKDNHVQLVQVPSMQEEK